VYLVTVLNDFVAVQPTDLQSHNITNTSVMISWLIVGPNIGCNGEVLESFRVRHRPVFVNRHRRSTTRETTTTLNALKPFTNYTLTVQTIDSAGSNALSDALTFHTLPGGKSFDITCIVCVILLI